jgi:lipoyl-dependent peroxiredoxin
VGLDERVRTIDGGLDLLLSKPKELGGGDGPGNNPFQLLAAAYSAIFHAALQAAFPCDGESAPDMLPVRRDAQGSPAG